MSDTEDITPDEAPPVLSTDDMLRQLIADQQEQRSEVASLRAELAKSHAPAPPVASATVQSPEELAARRQDEIADFEFYCPGCGSLSHYPRACTGRGEAPHPPIEVVSTDEIKGDNASDASLHTAAPGVRP